MLYGLIGFIFIFFPNLVLSTDSQISNCEENKSCLEKMSNFTEGKSLIKSREDSRSTGFESLLPPVSNGTAQTAEKEIQEDNDRPVDLAQSSNDRCRQIPWIK